MPNKTTRVKFHTFGFNPSVEMRKGLAIVRRHVEPMDYYIVSGKDIPDLLLSPFAAASWELSELSGAGPAANTIFRDRESEPDWYEWHDKGEFETLEEHYGVPALAGHVIVIWPTSELQEFRAFDWAEVLFHECYHAAHHNGRENDVLTVAEDEEEAYAAVRQFILSESPEDRDERVALNEHTLKEQRVRSARLFAGKAEIPFGALIGDDLMTRAEALNEKLDELDDDPGIDSSFLLDEIEYGHVSAESLKREYTDATIAELVSHLRERWTACDECGGGFVSPMVKKITGTDLNEFLGLGGAL